jgi:hypothetical protein
MKNGTKHQPTTSAQSFVQLKMLETRQMKHLSKVSLEPLAFYPWQYQVAPARSRAAHFQPHLSLGTTGPCTALRSSIASIPLQPVSAHCPLSLDPFQIPFVAILTELTTKQPGHLFPRFLPCQPSPSAAERNPSFLG